MNLHYISASIALVCGFFIVKTMSRIFGIGLKKSKPRIQQEPEHLKKFTPPLHLPDQKN